jgi:hypothetical protein
LYLNVTISLLKHYVTNVFTFASDFARTVNLRPYREQTRPLTV